MALGLLRIEFSGSTATRRSDPSAAPLLHKLEVGMVLGALSYTLEVPSLEDGIKFYEDAGLEVALDGSAAHLAAPRQSAFTT
jgi:hypothetical protein